MLNCEVWIHIPQECLLPKNLTCVLIAEKYGRGFFLPHKYHSNDYTQTLESFCRNSQEVDFEMFF